MRSLACALLFLTRIPLPRIELQARDFARSAGWFAWIGGLIALVLWGLAQLLVPWLGVRLGALSVIAAWVLITGGLHLDGLADTVDGLSGGRGEPTRTLAIMRDSRIGAHGALALGLIIALKWAALERLLELGERGWPIAPVGARFVCTLLIAYFPYARAEGLGSPLAGAVTGRMLALGASAVALSGWLLGSQTLAAALIGGLAALLLALRVRPVIAGLTGDVYGAAIELAELAALLGLCVLRRPA